MRFMVNCSLRPEKSRDAFIGLIKEGPAHESWELVQKRVVVEFAFKVGKVPGIFMLIYLPRDMCHFYLFSTLPPLHRSALHQSAIDSLHLLLIVE